VIRSGLPPPSRPDLCTNRAGAFELRPFWVDSRLSIPESFTGMKVGKICRSADALASWVTYRGGGRESRCPAKIRSGSEPMRLRLRAYI
jgi:hypothetical protein